MGDETEGSLSSVLFFIQTGKCYEMPSRPRKKEDSNSDVGDGIATNEIGGKKRNGLEVEDLPLPSTRKVGSMMTIIYSRKAHHANVCKLAMYYWREDSSCEDVLPHMNDEVHCKVPERNLG